jgi:hypothetical protein
LRRSFAISPRTRNAENRRSTGTKARTRVGRMRATPSDLEEQLRRECPQGKPLPPSTRVARRSAGIESALN